MNLAEKIKKVASDNFEKIVEIRRHIHQNPELSFQEFETSKFVQSKLDEFGIEYKTEYVKTGIVALIKGKNPEKKTLALRADMDALPILEKNEVDYKSKNEGIMHACGHDVHTSSLLGVAKILDELKEEFEGTVKLIFQPGEERLPGGASLMIKEGVLENPVPSKIFGQHVYPELPCGKIGLRGGMYMASADEIHVTVTGKGGHAALPHKFIDPIFISSQIITSLQQIVSRHAKPDVPTVLSFGKINSVGGATNIIPDVVKLEGTFRTMDEEWREKASILMKNMAESIAESMGGKCEFEVRKGYPFLENDIETTSKTKELAIEFLGAENVIDLDLRMTGEDFAYFTQRMPGCFYRLGTGKSTGLHTSTFNVDERSLETGMGLMSWIAINSL